MVSATHEFDEAEGQALQAVIDFQMTQLRAAFAITMETLGDKPDLDNTLATIARALTERAGFLRVDVEIKVENQDLRLERGISAGIKDTPPDEKRMEARLESQGRPFGRLLLWAKEDADIEERYAFLDFIVPQISVAIQNALQFAALSDYRKSLELKVIERTAELEQARQELVKSLEDLRAAEALRDRIFANISHELRTPLTIMLLSTEVLQRELGENAARPMQEKLQALAMGGHQLQRQIDEFLLLAARQEDKLRLNLSYYDLCSLVTQMIVAWTPAAEAKHMRLELQAPEQCPAFFDWKAVERMLANLLSNALKFTPAGGVVSLIVRAEDTAVILTVADTGIGIDEEFKSRIFGRFAQSKVNVDLAAQGSGIGLSLVKDLCEAHHGSIRADNRPEGGALFEIRLPQRAPAVNVSLRKATLQFDAGAYGAPVPRSPTRDEAKDTYVRAHQGRPGCPTLLIAEDNRDMAATLADLLHDDYTVIVAHDGQTALAQAEHYLPHMLIADVRMPGMSGLELAEKFLELPGLRLAPVLLVTASGSVDNRLAGFAVGAVDYIVKPFDTAELKARVSAQLARRELALKLHESEKLSALGLLSSGLAHELRNPANGVLNALEPLQRLLPSHLMNEGHPVKQLIDVAVTSSRQIAHLSRQLLGYQPAQDFQRKTESFSEVLHDSLALARRNQPEVQFQLDVVGNDTKVRCTGSLLMQALSNLLENGAHAAGKGGRVRLHTEKQQGWLVVDVSDTGPGVPPALRTRVFEPFFTTKPVGQGTGLGLWTTRDIVNKHNGTLEIISEGSSSFFRMRLPTSD